MTNNNKDKNSLSLDNMINQKLNKVSIYLYNISGKFSNSPPHSLTNSNASFFFIIILSTV